MSDETELQRAVGRIEGTLGQMSDLLAAHLVVDDRQHENMDKRVKSLEISRSWVLGAAAVVTAAVNGLLLYLKG